jgi:hypothetical protein
VSPIIASEAGVVKVPGFLKLFSPIVMNIMREEMKIISANLRVMWRIYSVQIVIQVFK